MIEPSMVRPVRCWYCGQQMYYVGHSSHEPEVKLMLDTGDTEETLYLHTRCWNVWQIGALLAKQ